MIVAANKTIKQSEARSTQSKMLPRRVVPKGRLRLALVLPCYNEEEALPSAFPRLMSCLDDLVKRGIVDKSSYLYFCDDGSTDSTWQILSREHRRYKPRVRALKLIGNVGKEKALYAALVKQTFCCDAAVSLDVDLQDDISKIEDMVETYHASGVDIVVAISNERSVDSWFKRVNAKGFYFLSRVLLGLKGEDSADFRLMSARSLQTLGLYADQAIYLRGLVSGMGFSQACVFYDRQPRIGGATKFSLQNLFSLAIMGITSQSTRPLRLVFFLGILMFFSGGIGIAYSLLSWWSGNAVPGWTSLILVFLLLMSLQSLALGVIGEYLGRVLEQVRSNPRYLIDEELE